MQIKLAIIYALRYYMHNLNKQHKNGKHTMQNIINTLKYNFKTRTTKQLVLAATGDVIIFSTLLYFML